MRSHGLVIAFGLFSGTACSLFEQPAAKAVVRYADPSSRPSCDESHELEIALTESDGRLALCSRGRWLPVASGATGATGARGATGATGPSPSVSLSPEPPGANCPAGGYKLTFYVDSNGNGVLDSSEQGSVQTAFVCGATGSSSPPSGASGSTGASGATGSTGATGATATSGTTTVMASGLYFPNFVAATTNKVFFTDRSGDTIYAIPKSGGAVTPFVTGLTAPVRKLASAGTRVLWQEQGGEVKGSDEAVALPRALTSGTPQAWAVTATHVFWASDPTGCTCPAASGNGSATVTCKPDDALNQISCAGGTGCTCATAGSISRSLLDGSGQTVLLSNPWTVTDIAADDSALYVLRYNGVNCRTSTNPGRQWARLMRFPFGSQSPQTILDAGAYNMATDGRFVVFSQVGCSGGYSTGQVISTGGAPVTTGTAGITRVASDSTSTFWATNSGLMRYSAGASISTSVLVRPSPLVTDFAIDATFIYVSDSSTGQLVRIVR